jgi:beta-galactosidase GanA
VFTVDGKPFFSVGGQARNSSGYNDQESEQAFKAVKLVHGNTLEIPVYWEQIEPEEGKFDFAPVDSLLVSARRYELKLVILWFATWKNGCMEYSPQWVKSDAQRFPRVKSTTDDDVWVLSSHYQSTLDADRKAFCALCDYLKQNDHGPQSVIAIQIENEPGILGSDRDYGDLAQTEFEGAVPAELTSALGKAEAGSIYEIWQEAGGKASGSWPELFGDAAGELMSAYSIARYIDQIAEAGKAILPVPMYVNVWLGENGWRIPGESYPSGGAVSKTLDIWRWCAPHLDLIAPDIYIPDSRTYEQVCANYAREDNPLFVPESGVTGPNAWNLFRAVGEYNAIGYHYFAIEYVLGADGEPAPNFEMGVDSLRCVSAAIPLLLEYQGTDHIHAVVQEDKLWAEPLDLDGYWGLIMFGDGRREYVHKDWRHPTQVRHVVESTENRGRGLIFQSAEHEFYVVGAQFRVVFRRKREPSHMLASTAMTDFLVTRQSHYLAVEEGHFDDQGEFVVDRRRNGDEIDHGVWVEPNVGVVRVRLVD